MLMTLSEILETCDDWQKFCERYGWSEWAVNEGGDDVEQRLSLDEAREFGIIKKGITLASTPTVRTQLSVEAT